MEEQPDSPTYESLRRAAQKAIRVENPDEYDKAYAKVLKEAHRLFVEKGALLSKDEALRMFHELDPTSDARFLEQWAIDTQPLADWTPRAPREPPVWRKHRKQSLFLEGENVGEAYDRWTREHREKLDEKRAKAEQEEEEDDRFATMIASSRAENAGFVPHVPKGLENYAEERGEWRLHKEIDTEERGAHSRENEEKWDRRWREERDMRRGAHSRENEEKWDRRWREESNKRRGQEERSWFVPSRPNKRHDSENAHLFFTEMGEDIV
jgi:hypothetical protein